MPSGNAVLSSANLQSRRETLSSESSSSSKATTSVLSVKAETPSSLFPNLSLSSDNPEVIDLGVDPITLLSTHILDRPSSLNQLCEHLDELKNKLQSDYPHTSQYLLVRRIPVDLFQRLLRTMKL
ncbi:hypothetical protein N7452_003968 [Penicillium brevicompactum]|uniref:Uncharacterized protein n=1 Tax=Penicillium brevicompactum TaxID=5074 RepID=A0A9W9QUW0_PENBR|nr:hypothetical protein N7452_003968 [Penicillium brevicompactum]